MGTFFHIDGLGNLTTAGSITAGGGITSTSTTAGFLLPSMTTTERNAIISPAIGLEIYNTTTNQSEFYNGLVWNPVGLNVGGVTSITGTTNEVIASVSTGSVTLSLPQAIAITSSPTFLDLILTDTISTTLLLNNSGGVTLTTANSGSAVTGGTLTLTSGNVSSVGSATGADILLTSGTTTTSATRGGSITLTSGINGGGGVGAHGGSITLTSGGGSDYQAGGNITLSTGDIGGSNQTMTGGSITLTSGNATGLYSAAVGGGLTLTAGSAGAGGSMGGSILLTSSSTINGGASRGGNITLTSSSPTNGGSLYLTGSGTNKGQIGIGTSTPDASASLDITSTIRGFLPPRMTTVQKTAIVSPATGLVVYDSTLNKLSVFTGALWETVTSA